MVYKSSSVYVSMIEAVAEIARVEFAGNETDAFGDILDLLHKSGESLLTRV